MVVLRPRTVTGMPSRNDPHDFQGGSMRKRRYLLLGGLTATSLAIGLLTATIGAASAAPISSARPDGPITVIYTVCSPSPPPGLAGFPNTGHTTHLPPGCTNNSFAWASTVSGNATSHEQWLSPNASGFICSAQAWIPDSASNDPNAQYYFYDGSHYLGNDAFVNQENVTNNWVNVTNNSGFAITTQMKVTLSNGNPMGKAGWAVGAYAMRFICTSGIS